MSSTLFFFFNDTATTEIYTLSLHDALPIWLCVGWAEELRLPWAAAAKKAVGNRLGQSRWTARLKDGTTDRKSTRLNSSHGYISYAVFCLKKKKKTSVLYTTLIVYD